MIHGIAARLRLEKVMAPIGHSAIVFLPMPSKCPYLLE
jgi:hypothetical protein